MGKWMNLFFLTVFTLVGLNSSLSAAAAETSISNKGTIGAVDIQLNYEVSSTKAILPNETVEVKSSVTNLAEPAYIRVKIQYPSYKKEEILDNLSKEDLTELGDKQITFANDKWEKHGPYYYWKEPVKTGETVPFTESILIPQDWDNRLIESVFGISFDAEAIQEKNFVPNFNLEDPWYGAVIEAYDATGYKSQGEANDQFSVHYEGGAEGLFTIGTNFFANWGTTMPGDALKEKVTIANNMKLPVRVFFQIDTDAVDEQAKKLLEQLQLRIWHGEQLIFDGRLNEDLPEMLLQEYNPGDKNDFSYELNIPVTVNNKFAGQDFHSIWTFRAQEVPQDVPEIVKTGEQVLIWLCIPLTIICICILIYFKNKKGVKQI